MVHGVLLAQSRTPASTICSTIRIVLVCECGISYGKGSAWVSDGFVFTVIDKNRLSNRKSDRKNLFRKESDSPALNGIKLYRA